MNKLSSHMAVAALAFACLCAVTPGGRAWAEEVAAEAEEPVAVVALISDDAEQAVIRLAAAVQAVLAETDGLDVLSAPQTASRLAGGAPAGPGRADMERLEGLFRQGYLQSYSFEYRPALITLERVLIGLRQVPSSPARWKLWERTRIFQGISHAGLRDEAEALRAFVTVLRTRPTMQLPRRDYSPKTIAMWNKARARLPDLPQGQLAVESEPSGAEVYLDGQLVGRTPLIARFPQGRYHLLLRHPDAGAAARWINLGRESTRIRLQLLFEGALVLDRAQPAVRLPAGSEDLPLHWWSWLGVRLGVRRLVVIRNGRSDDGRKRFIAALVDLERGRKLREGWLTPLEQDAPRAAEMEQEAQDLARFVSTGHASERLDVAGPAPEPLPGQADVFAEPGSFVPVLPIWTSARPWYRKWWPWAATAAALAGAGAGSALAWDDFDRRADKATNAGVRADLSRQSDLWRDVSLTAFSVSAVALLTGLVLHLTYQPADVEVQAGGESGAAALFRF